MTLFRCRRRMRLKYCGTVVVCPLPYVLKWDRRVVAFKFRVRINVSLCCHLKRNDEKLKPNIPDEIVYSHLIERCLLLSYKRRSAAKNREAVVKNLVCNQRSFVSCPALQVSNNRTAFAYNKIQFQK